MLTAQLEKIVNETAMKGILGERDVPHNVVVGGLGEAKPVPNINMYKPKWGKKTFINLNYHADRVINEVATYDGGKFSLTVGNNTHKISVLPNGNAKYNIWFTEKPPINELWFDLTDSDDFMYAKQYISEERLALGDSYTRPDAKGSIAVYHKTKQGNDGKNGKFAHWYRPIAYDANGVKVFCEIDKIDNSVCIQVPQDFLDKAQYPVCIDPELGYSVKGSLLLVANSSAAQHLRAFQASGNGVVTFLHIYPNFSGPDVKLNIYETDDTAPHYSCALQSLAAKGVTDFPAVQGVDNFIAATSLIPLVLGRWYRPGWIFNTEGLETIFGDGGFPVQQGNFYFKGPWANEPQDPYPVGNLFSWGNIFSEWVDFEEPPSGVGSIFESGIIKSAILNGGVFG